MAFNSGGLLHLSTLIAPQKLLILVESADVLLSNYSLTHSQSREHHTSGNAIHQWNGTRYRKVQTEQFLPKQCALCPG